MTPDWFRDAKRIYNSALERAPAEREAYLAEACGGDESLKQEVESLLGCRAEAQEFFKATAIEAGAKALAREAPIDFSGRTVSHYAIVERIGEGGMGVVYKARDTHLDRLVALKVLPPEKVGDPERRRRFVQEAKAASALNHPNIVTIHDIDTADSVTFIAMEFVQGRTLDRLIRSKGIVLNETLKHGVQIADALAAAHRAGIIHRDIKPANIMVTDTGQVKVLDFGLAKLTEPGESAAPEATRNIELKTEAGMILGTVAYMSPEQAEGKEVDARSDIFSFGSLLYEMTTGRRAFSGETNASTLAAILREEPKPVRQMALDTPRELERVISRCLKKDPQRRFQHMADLKVALEELKEETDSGKLAPRPGRWKHLPHRLAWAASALVLGAALGLGAWFGILRRPAAGPAAKVRTFTGFPGIERRQAFSPDGKQLAFSWSGEKGDNRDIYVQRVDEATPRRLTTDPAVDYSPAWSPDALDIAFLRDTPAGTEVLRIPAAGGPERRLHVSAVRPPATVFEYFCGLAWSPDGKFLAIVDKESERAPRSVYRLDIETREKQRLTTPPSEFWDGMSVFSPDGRSLAFLRGRGWPLSDIYILRLSDTGQPRGEPQRITQDNAFIFGLDWTEDGRNVVFSSSRGGSVWGLWRVPVSGGTPERLTVGGSDAYWPSVSRKGNRLAYSYGGDDANVWRAAAPGASTLDPAAAAPMRISQSPQWDEDPTFSPDGKKIAWTSMRWGSHQVWICNSDGSQPWQLTHLDAPGAAHSQWSPDGRQIAFLGFNPWPARVYVLSAEGGAPHRLTTGDFAEVRPRWSRDGKWVYFRSNRGEGYALWKAPAGGGSPVLVARNGRDGVESLDGKFVYYDGPEESIWKLPAGGGSPVLVARNGWGAVESLDGKFVYYNRPGGMWKVPVAGGEAAPVLKTGQRARWTLSAAGLYVLDPDAKGGPSIELFPFVARRREVVRLPGKPDSYVGAGTTSSLAASPDGRWILYHRIDRAEADIMLVENFR